MQEQKSSVGGIIGTIVIISIIILGGLYFWGKRVEDAKLKQNLVTDNTGESLDYNEANVIRTISSSDDLNSIEADLNSTNLEDLDREINPQVQ